MAIDFEQLKDSPHLLDILVQMEDVLDSMDVYVFKNWLKGEVVEGPVVRRYWLDLTLRYAYDEMPDPRAALRLLKHGVRVDFEKARYESEGFGKGEAIKEDDEVKEEDLAWLVRVSIPRRLVVQMNAQQHDFYDDEVDIDQVEDAKDDGLDDESAFDADDQGSDPMTDPDAAGGDPMADPMAPPGGAGGPPQGAPR